jgi:predicted amidophosphoribosyltransferase
MSFKSRDRKKERRVGLLVILIIGFTAFSLVFSLLINPLWWILLPISFFFIFIYQIMSKYFWLEKKVCPRCNTPVGRYSEYCRNCGLKLWFRCISCGKYLRTGTKFCDNCNIELKHSIEEREAIENNILKKEFPSPKKPNHCSNCGAKFKYPAIMKFCEKCGTRIE